MTTRAVLIGGTNQPVPAGKTATYKAQLIDESGNPIGPAAVNTMLLTIIDSVSLSVINSVSQTNILNTGRGTLDSSGNLVVVLGGPLNPGDLALFNTNSPDEERSIIIEWTYNGATKSGSHRVDFMIVAMIGP